MTDEHVTPEGSWLVAIGRDKAPVAKFGGWNVEEGPEPSGRQACWGHENTYEVPDNETAHRLVSRLKEAGGDALLLDIDGANLLVLDYDVADGDEEADIAGGKWPDAGTLEGHVREEFPGQTLWRSKGGGFHVPVLLTDEAYVQVFENEWSAGFGVDSLKGPAAKGYTASPFSPGYEVAQSGGFPVWGVEHLERFEGAAPSSAGRAGSRDPGDFEPAVDRETAHSAEATDDMYVLLSAINQLTPDDFRAPCRRVGRRADGDYDFEPSWRNSQSGNSLGFLSSEGVWYDRKEGKGMFSDKLVALDMGLISSPHDRLDGEDWWEAVDRLREFGAPLPEWEGEETGTVAGLEDPAAAFGGGGDEGKLWEIRREFEQQVRLAAEQGRSGHIVGPKAVGKTRISVLLARERKVAIFAPTKEKYREIIAEAEKANVSVLRLPSFPEHSALWGDWEAEYLRGAMPREIYNWEERDVGEDEYLRRQGEDFDDYDLLVGAPEHAHIKSVVDGRTVFFDDSELDAYREEFDGAVGDDINRVLTAIDSRYGNWKQLRRRGDWATVERELVAHLSETDDISGLTVDEALESVTSEPETNVDRRAFLARIPGVGLDVVDWMRALTGDLHSSTAYEDRGMRLVTGHGGMTLVRAPDLSGAEQVFTMGAWPAEGLEQAFEDMNAEYEGMFGSDRHGEFEEAQNRFVIQTSRHVHNKSTKGREDPERVKAIAEGLERLGREVGLEEDAQIFSTLRETKSIEGAVNYGQLTGSNEYSDDHLAVVGGSQHFGDDWVNAQAAYAGEAPKDPESDGPFTPRRWDGGAHQEIEERMRRSGAYEAITRTGRGDTEPTIVAADTCELPPWLQVVDQSDRVRRMSPAAETLLELIRESDDPVAIKNQGDGAVDKLDYSAVRLYEAKEELVEGGLVEEAEETGAYRASKYEAAPEDEPVNPNILGLQVSGLTGSSFSPAQNPDWDVEKLDPEQGAAADPQQTTLYHLIGAD